MDASNPLCNLYTMGNNEQYVQKESLGFQENWPIRPEKPAYLETKISPAKDMVKFPFKHT